MTRMPLKVQFSITHIEAFLYMHTQCTGSSSGEMSPSITMFESSRHPLRDEIVCITKGRQVWLQQLFFLLVFLLLDFHVALQNFKLALQFG